MSAAVLPFLGTPGAGVAFTPAPASPQPVAQAIAAVEALDVPALLDVAYASLTLARRHPDPAVSAPAVVMAMLALVRAVDLARMCPIGEGAA